MGSTGFGFVYRMLKQVVFGRVTTSFWGVTGSTLRSFVKDAIPANTVSIADPSLFSEEENEENKEEEVLKIESLVSAQKLHKLVCLVLEVGINCSVELPSERMDISDAIHKLHAIKSDLLGSYLSEQ